MSIGLSALANDTRSRGRSLDANRGHVSDPAWEAQNVTPRPPDRKLGIAESRQGPGDWLRCQTRASALPEGSRPSPPKDPGIRDPWLAAHEEAFREATRRRATSRRRVGSSLSAARRCQESGPFPRVPAGAEAVRAVQRGLVAAAPVGGHLGQALLPHLAEPRQHEPYDACDGDHGRRGDGPPVRPLECCRAGVGVVDQGRQFPVLSQ